jgi:hypothetical protein
MSVRFGRCLNSDYCTLAEQRAVLRLDDGEPFNCPQCARPLAAAPGWKNGGAGRLLRRIALPMCFTALGLAVVITGLRHPEPPAPPAKNVARPIMAASAAQLPQPPKPRPAPAKPVPHLAAPSPPPELVVLHLAASPPLNTMLVPQLAAAYLAIGRDSPAIITTVGDAIHIAVNAGSRDLVILVHENPFDAGSIANDRTDMMCTPNPPTAADRQVTGPLAELVLGAMPADPHPVIRCYNKIEGPAADFAAFLATPDALQIVASSGYQLPAPPLPVPPAAPPTAKPPAALPKPAPRAVAPPMTDASTDNAEAAPTPRRIIVPPGSPLTLEAMKALTTPDQPTPDNSDAPPKPRTIYLPASARLSYGAYQGVKIPDQPSKLFFVNPASTRSPGSLKVDCNISTEGLPTDCREIAHEGAQEAASAILAWLPSGAIRYAPVVKDGRKVSERRVLTVNYGGAAVEGK